MLQDRQLKHTLSQAILSLNKTTLGQYVVLKVSKHEFNDTYLNRSTACFFLRTINKCFYDL